jgi:hypothetical protein
VSTRLLVRTQRHPLSSEGRRRRGCDSPGAAGGPPEQQYRFVGDRSGHGAVGRHREAAGLPAEGQGLPPETRSETSETATQAASKMQSAPRRASRVHGIDDAISNEPCVLFPLIVSASRMYLILGGIIETKSCKHSGIELQMFRTG